MIKYLGSIGTFIRLNDSEDKTYTLLNVFSSSVTDNLLFSANINSLTGSVSFDSASTVLYVNGKPGSVISPEKWSHIVFSFENKLSTSEENNFIVRMGDSASSNFNIQNLYILEQSFTASAAGYLHEEFTGGGGYKVRINDPATYTFNIKDAPENNFISASSGTIYQPLKGQLKYGLDLDAVTDQSLSQFISTTMEGDDLYVDGHNLQPGAYVLSLADNQIYQLTTNSNLTTVSSSVGYFYKSLYGQYLGETFFIKTPTGFELTLARPKINYYLNIIQTNNA